MSAASTSATVVPGRTSATHPAVAGSHDTPLAMLVSALRTDAPVLVDGLARAATDGALTMADLAARVDAAEDLGSVVAAVGHLAVAAAGVRRQLARPRHERGCWGWRGCPGHGI